MDAKDLKTESALEERNNDGIKYARDVAALHCNRNKPYLDIGSNPLAKVDIQATRPCAVIGPDRVVPPPSSTDAYLKKGPVEPLPCQENIYRFVPEYQNKVVNNQNPTRNISPRQTFQENMSRILVPPTYNTTKVTNEHNFALAHRNVALSKNIKSNVPSETKYCDVPYTVNPMANEPKSSRNPDMCVSSVQHPVLACMAPPGWPPGSVNLHAARSYGTPELYQYPEYPSCAGPRSVSMSRPHRPVVEDPGHMYTDPYYQEANVRFKPYPNVKDRYPQARYEYIGNYSNPFHPPPFPTNKYDIPKSIHPPHQYPTYPHLKYLDKRMVDPVMNGYQRQTNLQGNYMPFRNQMIHPNYGPVVGNCLQNKMHPFPTDVSGKSIAANKVPYENSNKIYIDYGNARSKSYMPPDSYFVNEMSRAHPMKNQVNMPNYQPVNVHTIPPQPYYKKENPQLRSLEHMHHLRNNLDSSLNISNPISQFSPTAIAISPTESNTSNDTTQTQGYLQEDCGYVSQSSTTSVRSMESANNRLANDFYRKYYDFRYGHVARNSPMLSRSELKPNNNINFKDKKQINLRQFIQMWNEGEEDNGDNNNSTKEININPSSNEGNNFSKLQETVSNQEQLYVLGLVNVSSEELSKYEHIQKVSKLPENIKGYNGIELLNQFEEVTESPNISCFKPPTPKELQTSFKDTILKQATELTPRPLSPLDVEAKISQSVIHKEVGCNFEIKPCSPKMLNVDIASPIQNILGERVIEKISNPLSTMVKTPNMSRVDENRETCNLLKRQDHILTLNQNLKISSCKMVKNQFSPNNMEPTKTDYSLQDLESNSGVCLASLPRLDNDIELSFPEVNQQFINANKRESPMPESYLKNLPEIVEQSDKLLSKEKDALQPHTDCSNQLSPVMENEKEFTKLSKYRKVKTNSLEPNNIFSQLKTIRTDSVIIKNPENPKNIEENMEFLSVDTSFTDETQQAPMNLTSRSNLKTDNVLESGTKTRDNHCDPEVYPSVDTAIDFSLNKIDSDHSDYNFNIKEIKLGEATSMRNVNDETQKSIDTIDTSTKFQHYEDSIPAKSNSTLTSENVIEIPKCEQYDVKLEPDAQINNYLSYKENVNKELVKADNEFLDMSTPDINNDIDCDNFNANFALEHENYVSIFNNVNKKNTSNNGNDSMDVESEDNKINTVIHKEYNINESNADDSLDKDEVSPVKNTDVKSSSKIASCSTTVTKIYSNSNESMHKISSYSEKALIGSPKEQVTTTELESNSKIIDSEHITFNDPEPVALSEDCFTENALLRDTRKDDCVNEIDQNFGAVNKEIDCYGFDHSTKKLDHLFLEKLCSKNCEENPKQETLFRRYFSKELHSPWMQKLIMHNDGLCCNNCLCDVFFSKNTAHKIVDRPLTDIIATVPCIDYITEETDNKLDLIKLQSERTKIYYSECCDDISNIVEKCIGITEINELQSEIITSGFDNKSMQSDIKNNITDEITIKDIKLNIIKGELDYSRGCLGKITDMVDSSEKEKKIDQFQPEISETVFDNNCTDIVNKLKPEIIKTACDGNCTDIVAIMQPEIMETAFDNNCTPIRDKFQPDNIDTASDNCTDIVNYKNEINSTEELRLEITKSEFDHHFKCTNNVTDKVDNSEEENNIEIHLVRTRSELNNSSGPIANITDKVNSSTEQETKIEELHLEIKTGEFYNKHRCIDSRIIDMVDTSRIDTDVHDLQPEKMKIESDDHRTDIENDWRNGTGIDELHVRVIKDEFNNTCGYTNTDNVTDTLDHSKEKTTIENWQSEIKRRALDDDIECINIINDVVHNVKEEIKIEELQPATMNSDCDHNRKCVDIIKMVDNKKEETCSTDELETKLTKVEYDLNCDCINEKEEIDRDHFGESIHVTADLVDNMKYENNKGKLQSDIMSDDFYYDCPFNDIITDMQLPKSIDDISLETEHHFLEENQNAYINNTDPNTIEKRNNFSVSNVQISTDMDSKSPTYKKMTLCVPKKQVNNISNDNTNDKNIKQVNEVNTLQTTSLLSRTCNEQDIIKQDNTDNTGVNYVDSGFENEPFKSPQLHKRRLTLKRSYSDSALNSYNIDNNIKQDTENIAFFWPVKRKKINEIQNIETDMIAENLRKIIQNNRRNSISSFYNEDVSFCILIDDNCIITEGNETEKICYTELPENCLEEIHSTNEEDHIKHTKNFMPSPPEDNCEYSDSFTMGGDEEKTFEESWFNDVACIETVVSDDIAEDIIISAPSSPKDIDLSHNNDSGFFKSSSNNGAHTDKVKYIYGGKMCSDDANFLETLYKTPQMDVNKTLTNREYQVADNTVKYYDKESLEKILSECNSHENSSYTSNNTETILSSDVFKLTNADEHKNVNIEMITPLQTISHCLDVSNDMESIKMQQDNVESDILKEDTQDDTVHTCESSIDNVFTYGKEDEGTHFITSSSPEVSSTTSEEKSSSILLKITNRNGAIISQINNINPGCRSSCKYTEEKDYSQSNLPSRPLITKAAQKYIPPLKESIRDLKVKLSLPQQSLMKLKQLKISKVEPKLNKCNAVVPIISKKPKPKFEDVLKSIDEIQFKKHKEKNKKTKTVIPKVVIKKNRNGSHYASTSNKDIFNPDLTGRKWQPWVFLEKNNFIDKMAIKKKTRAVYNHRKNAYVLAEKFCKYKSVSNAKFIISQPKLDSSSKGHLKYTIRLKHSY